jgi:hypothetical protein
VLCKDELMQLLNDKDGIRVLEGVWNSGASLQIAILPICTSGAVTGFFSA